MEARSSRPAATFTDDKGRSPGSTSIVTVPTPVTVDNQPTWRRPLGQPPGAVMKKGAIVVYESTVYPGVTEDVCGPELEQASVSNAV
jgi:UDP-N-acetyl-D-mannosaminuronate dehydrogenase